MTPDHGTRARYLRGCKCPACLAAHSAYCKRYRYVTAVEPRRGDQRNKPTRPMRMPVAPVAAHIATLVASGMTLATIQREAQVSNAHASKVLNGQVRTIHKAIAARILAVEPLPDPASVIDEVAIERVLTGNATVDTLTRSERHAARVEAARRGWTATEIAQRLRVSGSDARRLVEAVTS